jgi:hypothetical protein
LPYLLTRSTSCASKMEQYATPLPSFIPGSPCPDEFINEKSPGRMQPARALLTVHRGTVQESDWGITITAQGAWPTTLAVTLPMSSLFSPVRP